MGIACYPCMGKFKQSIYGLTVCLPYSCCFNVIQLSITIVTCRLRAIFVVLLILITSNLELKVPKKYLCSCAYAVMSEIMRKQSVNSSLHTFSFCQIALIISTLFSQYLIWGIIYLIPYLIPPTGNVFFHFRNPFKITVLSLTGISLRLLAITALSKF